MTRQSDAPKIKPPLDQDKIEKAKKHPGRYRHKYGLFLKVRSPTNCSWVFRYQRKGEQHLMGLGSLEKVTLKQAEAKALKFQLQLSEGQDPHYEREKQNKADEAARLADLARKVTFEQAARAWWEVEKIGLTEDYANQMLRQLELHAFPTLGKKVVGDITREDVRATLMRNNFWLAMCETASKVQNYICRVMNYAAIKDWRTGTNPAEFKGNLEFLLPSQPASEKNHACVPWEEMPDFMVELRERDATAAKALEFLILTAARTSEVLEARWSEIDLDKGVWTVPRARMKTRKTMKIDHRVPLCTQAIELLESLKGDLKMDDPFIFPGPITDKLSGMSMAMLLRRMGRPDVTVHGFRSSFRDWAADQLTFPRELAQRALCHVVNNKAEEAYQRSDQLELRRPMMQAWANFIGKPFDETNVVPINKGKAA